MLPYDVVLFDLDGTLTESGIGIMNAIRYALTKMGREVVEETLPRYVGPPLFESFCEYAHLSDEDARTAVATYREYYNARGWAENRVYEGIPRILKTLKKNGARLYLVTGKPEVFSRRILTKFGLDVFFDGISAITLKDEHVDKKELIERVLPMDVKKACMVGDRKFDIEGANGAKIDSVGVLYGYGNREELEKEGATHIARDVSALQSILLGDVPVAEGLFLSLEGTDGCGKTTQKEKITEFLTRRGWSITHTREPGGCPLSEKIRDMLLSVENSEMTPLCEAYLFAASRAQHVRQVIRPALRRGDIVLCDRFVDSSVAYQGAARGLGIETVQQINRDAVDGTMPDQTLFFDLAPEIARARRINASEPDRIEREKEEFADKVYQGYCALAEQEPNRITRIDASGTVEDVFARAEAALSNILTQM